MFVDPDRAAVKALGLERAAGVRLRPRRRHRRSRRRGLDGCLVAGRRRRHRRRRRRGARRTSRSSATPARSTGRPPSADRAALARAPRPADRRAPRRAPRLPSLTPGRVDRRRTARRRQDHRRARWPLLDEPWLAGRRIVMLEPRRLATRAAARRMADLTGTAVGDIVGYQTRDERRIGPATRIEVLTEGVLTRRLQQDPELPGRRAGHLRRGPRAQPDDRPRAGVHARRGGDAAARPADRGDVGDRRHRPLRPPAGHRRRPGAGRRERRADAPGRRALGASRVATIASRRPMAGGDPAGAARRATATCSSSCPASARSPASPSSSMLGPGVDVHRLAGALGPDEQDQALAPSPPVAGGSCWPPTSPRRR